MLGLIHQLGYKGETGTAATRVGCSCLLLSAPATRIIARSCFDAAQGKSASPVAT